MSTTGALAQTEGVLARTIGDEAMLLHPSGTPALALNETAAAIWAACDPPAPAETVVSAVAEAYRVEPDAVRGEVESVLEQMVGLGFLRPA